MNTDLFNTKNSKTYWYFLNYSLASVQPTLDFCRRLDSIVGPQLTVLASDICEQFNINKRMSGFVLCFVFTF